jgi:WD40 repeat protein/serine/threonine protein kinase
MADTPLRQMKGYELREELGQGGFGVVYRAYQPIVGREVAIKIILPIYANQPGFIRRFESEAQLVARLEHPYIVPLFDFWRDNEGAYLVMRYLRSGSLRELIEQSAISPQRTVKIVNQVASALAMAHRNGVVHRDVKPHNILMDGEGNAYLTDFGIARTQSGIDADEETMFSGSPAYAAPEVITTGAAKPQADIYALGIVIYEMLTGKHPFTGEKVTSMLIAQLNEPVPPLPDELGLPDAVNEVIQKATAKDSDERYTDAMQLANALKVALLGKSATSPLDDTPIDARNPYKGLMAFEEADANDFFGREALVGAILTRMVEEPQTGHPDYRRFLAVVGSSASGKTSTVQAGVLPALRNGAVDGSERWYIVQIEPDDRPITNIYNALLSIASRTPPDLETRLRTDPHSLNDMVAAVLRDPDSELLLVIDNFHETWTLTEDEQERIHYLQMLYHAVTTPQSRVRVLILLRSDFYDLPLHYEGFASLMQERTQLVFPMTREELSSAIQFPAENVSVQIEKDLREAILEDIGSDANALPLMQYALAETFEQREGRRLTATGYRKAGGIYGALSTRAEAVYAALPTTPIVHPTDPHAPPMNEQDIAKQVFLRLVEMTELGVRRRRAERRDLIAMSDPAAVNHVLDEFGAARLLMFEGKLGSREPQVEIGHEALIQVWERLKEWVEESRDDIRVEEALRRATDDWLKAQRDPSYLLTGGRLAGFASWAASTQMALTPDETAFLTASDEAYQQKEREEEARQQRELQLAQDKAETSRRAATRLRLLAGVLMVAFLAMGVLFVMTRNAQAAAETAREEAARRAEEALSLKRAFVAQVQLINGRSDIALAVALQAVEIDNPSPVITSILMETAYTRGTRQIYQDHQSKVMAVALSPDGTLMVSGGGKYTPTQEEDDDHIIRLWDVKSNQVLRTFEGHGATVWSLAFSPDGTQFASASADQTLKIWDVQTGALLHTLTGHSAIVRTLAYSPDGTRLLSGSGDYSDGTMTETDDFSVRLWNATNGEALCTFAPIDPLKSEVRSVAFSPDGVSALSASGAEYNPDGENVIIEWEVERCRERTRMYGHTNIVQHVDYSPDGTRFVSASADNSVIVWSLINNQPLRYLNGHGDWVNTAIFDRSGQYIVSGGWENSAILWNANTGNMLYQFVGHDAPIQALAFNADGLHFVSASQDGTLREWDYESPLLIARYGRSTTEVGNHVAYSPDGASLLISQNDGTLVLYNTATQERLASLSGHEGEVYSIAFSKDGQRILSSGSDGKVLLWDVATRSLLRPFEGHEGIVWRAVFSPDETQILSASDDSTVRLWDVNTGELLHIFSEGVSEVYTAAFAADGKTIFAGTLDNVVIRWDATTYDELSRTEGHTAAPYTSAASPDGRYFVTGGYDNRLILWDANTGALVRQFYGHSKSVAAVAFSPDGQTLISASSDRSVRFWDVNTGTEKGRIEYGVNLVDMALSADGTTLALAADDELTTTYQLPILDLPQLREWITANRVTYTLSCEEGTLYGVEVDNCSNQ